MDNGDGTVSIFYKVKDAGEYTVSIKFGGQPVSGGFYTFTVSKFNLLQPIISCLVLRLLCYKYNSFLVISLINFQIKICASLYRFE